MVYSLVRQNWQFAVVAALGLGLLALAVSIGKVSAGGNSGYFYSGGQICAYGSNSVTGTGPFNFGVATQGQGVCSGGYVEADMRYNPGQNYASCTDNDGFCAGLGSGSSGPSRSTHKAAVSGIDAGGDVTFIYY